ALWPFACPCFSLVLHPIQGGFYAISGEFDACAAVPGVFHPHSYLNTPFSFWSRRESGRGFGNRCHLHWKLRAVLTAAWRPVQLRGSISRSSYNRSPALSRTMHGKPRSLDAYDAKTGFAPDYKRRHRVATVCRVPDPHATQKPEI